MFVFNVVHPDISENFSTLATAKAAAGATSLSVKNTSGFSQNDFILLGTYGDFQAQIVQIVGIPDTKTLTVGALSFPVSVDEAVTKLYFDQIHVYRSVTGVGGTYASFGYFPFAVANTVTQIEDINGVSPYSYKAAPYNSYLSIEGPLSSELPLAGFPQYSVRSMVDRTFSIFGESELQEFITRQDIVTFINELLERVHLMITGGESPLYLNNVVLTPPANQQANDSVTIDLSQYNIVNISLIEYSYDGGTTYYRAATPVDARFGYQESVNTDYAYSLTGNTLRIMPGPTPSVLFRVWYYTNPALITQDGDVLPNPLQSISRLFVDYALMRCHEKDRKMTELAEYYKIKLFGAKDDGESGEVGMFVHKLKQRLKQGDFQIGQTESFFSTFFG